MREVWPRFNADSFLGEGFPYPGELAYGYRNGFIDGSLLVKVIERLACSEIPLTSEELEIAALFSGETDRIRYFALQLSKYERSDASEIWQYYFVSAVANGVSDPVEKFTILDSVWADLEYPDGMIQIIYPKEGFPAHLYPMLGGKALSDFLARWSEILARRDARGRLHV